MKAQETYLRFVTPRPIPWRAFAAAALLCYPIMGSKWFPFGGGPRYLSVLVGPISLLLLWHVHGYRTVRPLLIDGAKWAAPFFPFVFAWMFAQLWHQYEPVDLTPLSSVVWCGLLFVGARIVGITRSQLARVSGIAAFLYGCIAVFEVFVAGRYRAWGGVYENRFGQYAVWVASLCVLHVFFDEFKSKALQRFLLFAAACGLIAAWLSGSRGALAALLVLFSLLLHRTISWYKVLLATILFTISIGMFCYFSGPIYERFFLIYQEIMQYFREPVFTATSIGIRFELARVALLTWHEHPVLGVGYVSIKQLYESYPNLGVPDPGILVIPGFHSDWFQAIGIGGGVLLFSLFATVLWLLFVAKGDRSLMMFVGFSIVFSFSELFMTHNLGLGLLMSSWALYSAAERNRTETYEAN